MKTAILLVFVLAAQAAYTQATDHVSLTNLAGDYVPNYFNGCQTDVAVRINGKKPTGKVDLSAPYDHAIITKDGEIFHIVPGERREIHLTVLSDNAAIATINIVTRQVPAPIAKIYVDDKLLLPDVKISRTAKVMKVLADNPYVEDFGKSCPRDTTYSVVSMNLNINGGNMANKGGEVDLSKFAGMLKTAESIGISNVRVQRTTWDGKTAEVLGSKMTCMFRIEK